MYLDTACFVVTKKLLLKVLYIKVKVSWNSMIKPINSTKSAVKTMNNNKNKLNSKISY